VEKLIGIPVSPGVAVGPAVLLLRHPMAMRYAVAGAHVPREIARLNRARELSAQQLGEIGARVAAGVGADLAQLFEAQLLMLDDRLLVPRARDIITHERVNAEWAVQRAFDELCEVLEGAGDEYLRERRGDIADVVGRLRRNLYTTTGRRQDPFLDLDEGAVLVADELPPSLAVQLDRRRVIALATDTGSRTHHSAILARSIGLPAVVGLSRATSVVRPGMTVLIDGTLGEVLVEPPADLIAERLARRDAPAPHPAPAVSRPGAPIATSDGIPVRLEANIEFPSEIEAARASGAQGIGLFRSEFMLGGEGPETLDEGQQYAVYRQLAEGMAPLPVTIRTFDFGDPQGFDGEFGARGAAGASAGAPGGPLGMRAIRLSLDRLEGLRVQLRALVRAARHGHVRVLLPFVTSVDEVRRVRVELDAIRAGVTAIDGLDPELPLGAMIEVPAAALTADLLADDVDFFSVGTNDLVQYCLAVDRTDGRMARLYEPLHPAVLRMIRLVVKGAQAKDRVVEVCGEMAAEPASLAVLLGLGVTAFSMNPVSIPAARRVIRGLTLRDAARLARAAMRLKTGREVAAFVTREIGSAAARPSGGPQGDDGE
jgi:phosphotransferase system enzyme I (PtsI)